jgi:hypothetical protein
MGQVAATVNFSPIIDMGLFDIDQRFLVCRCDQESMVFSQNIT